MNCKDPFPKNIFKGFNAIISGLTVCCSRVLARSKVPTVMGCGHTSKRKLIQFQKLIVYLHSAQTPVFKMFLFVIKQRTSKTLRTVTDFVIFPLLLYFAMNHF